MFFDCPWSAARQGRRAGRNQRTECSRAINEKFQNISGRGYTLTLLPTSALSQILWRRQYCPGRSAGAVAPAGKFRWCPRRSGRSWPLFRCIGDPVSAGKPIRGFGQRRHPVQRNRRLLAHLRFRQGRALVR